MDFNLNKKIIVAGISVAIATVSSAQETSTKTDQVESSLDTMLVTGAQIPIDEAILPTSRPSSTAFGIEQNIIDVPRNVTIVSREQWEAVGLTDVRDFSKLTPSLYTPATFGAPSNPSIRGQVADVLVNGMRTGLTSGGEGMPINLNSVESVDVMKGPPTAVYGASGYVGGFVNLVTKKPYFSKFQGEASFTIGMYDQRRWSLDFGGPISKTLAYRVSYSGEESGSYYDNGKKNTQAIYGAITWAPESGKYTLDLNVEAYTANFTENFGINRPTQDLVDNGNYITGTVGDVNGDGTIDNRDISSGYNYVYPTGTVKISRSARVLRPGNGSDGKEFRLQAIQTLVVNDNFSIVNNTMAQYQHYSTHSDYSYTYYLPQAVSFENRTEFHLDFDTPIGGKEIPVTGKDAAVSLEKTEAFNIGHQINFGVDIRYQEGTAYTDYANEPTNVWDLSQDANLINYVNYGNVYEIPGQEGRYAASGITNSGSARSNIFTLGPYYQHSLKLGKYFMIDGGARVDIIWAGVQDPLFDDYLKAHPTFTGDGEDRTVVALPNFNISPVVKPFPWMSVYFTYNYSQSYPTGTTLSSVKNNISAVDYHRVSELFEIGTKFSLLEDTLFISAAVFKQSRVIQNSTGTTNKVDVQGFELETTYQPSRNFYVSLGYTYLDAQLKDQTPYSVNSYPINEAPTNSDGGLLVGTFGGYYPYTKGDYKMTGQPSHLINALAKYQFDTSIGTFGATVGLIVTGPQNLNFDGSVVIPWQKSIDLTVFYKDKSGKYEARLAFLNLTDEKNWSASSTTYANDSIVADLPFRMEATVSCKF